MLQSKHKCNFTVLECLIKLEIGIEKYKNYVEIYLEYDDYNNLKIKKIEKCCWN